MKWLFLFVAFTLAASGQRKTACSFVTQQDAESILGPKAMQHVGPGSCAWNLPNSPLVFVVIVDSNPQIKQQIYMPRTAIAKAGGTVREEPGVWGGAYSTTIPGAQTIYLLKGDTGASITITNDRKGVLPDMLDKLRPVAKRIVGRM